MRRADRTTTQVYSCAWRLSDERWDRSPWGILQRHAEPLRHSGADIGERDAFLRARARSRLIRPNGQQLVHAFGEEQIERMRAIGRPFLRIQPDVIGELLDIDERAGWIFDERALIGRTRLREEEHAAERPELVSHTEARDEHARLCTPQRLDRRPFDK